MFLNIYSVDAISVQVDGRELVTTAETFMRRMAFVYMELQIGDAPRARSFYSELLGWQFQEIPTSPAPYASITSGGESVGGLSKASGPSQWLGYIGVPDVAAATAKAKALGANIEVDSQPFGALGRLSVLIDPTGARVGLWEAARIERRRNEWSVVIDHKDLLELRWLSSTSSMTDGGFMATLCLFAGEAEKAQSSCLLIDATEFKHTFGAGVMEWRDAHIIPRYGAAGVRKFAFVMPPGFPRAGTEEHEGPAVFPTKWFTDRQAALAWLRD
jgi:predicted enzyme related to lactoylglutathione lyase